MHRRVYIENNFSFVTCVFFSTFPGDLEKEKRKLQNILATGEEEPKVYRKVPARPNPEAAEQKDRYQEGASHVT